MEKTSANSSMYKIIETPSDTSLPRWCLGPDGLVSMALPQLAAESATNINKRHGQVTPRQARIPATCLSIAFCCTSSNSAKTAFGFQSLQVRYRLSTKQNVLAAASIYINEGASFNPQYSTYGVCKTTSS